MIKSALIVGMGSFVGGALKMIAPYVIQTTEGRKDLGNKAKPKVDVLEISRFAQQ